MTQAVSQERPRGLGWTLLRTVTVTDPATPATSVFTAADPIRTPFVDLRLRKTAGAWGAGCAIQMVEVVDYEGVDEGVLGVMSFKDCSTTVTVTSDQIISGITATGRVEVKVTAMDAGLTGLKIWVRPS